VRARRSDAAITAESAASSIASFAGSAHIIGESTVSSLKIMNPILGYDGRAADRDETDANGEAPGSASAT
jgi:hypothetical protein